MHPRLHQETEQVDILEEGGPLRPDAGPATLLGYDGTHAGDDEDLNYG